MVGENPEGRQQEAAVRLEDGGVLVQYWFFYPFNDAHWLFDHEGDWEHVAVRLERDQFVAVSSDGDGEPVQQDPCHGVHAPVLVQGRSGPRLARQVDRRVLVHERQRHELREPARLALVPGDARDYDQRRPTEALLVVVTGMPRSRS